MLFNSYSFLFVFLPLVLMAVWVAKRHGSPVCVVRVLLLGSLVFYAVWNPFYLALPLLSLCFNFLVARRLGIAGGRFWVILGVAANLLLLGYFKYYSFFLSNLSHLLGFYWDTKGLVLPLAISFFTFQQIAYLVDVYKDPSCRITSFTYYATFVIFFPHFIAGPIVHHRCLVPQLQSERLGAFSAQDSAVGVTLFAVGLFKKVYIADGLMMPHARLVFDAAASYLQLNPMDAWLGVLCYTFQVYFDFSGYSDMACGLARILGVTFPINFNSPYQASSIISFWRRWHMTLSEFLKTYLYIPLGGNQGSGLSQCINLMLVMTLGGLWHGAQWTYVVWGALHGGYLIINHAWRKAKAPLGLVGRDETWWATFIYHQMTFLAVVLGWVFFRADSLSSACSLLKALVGCGSNVAWPDSFQGYEALLSRLGFRELVFDNYAFVIKTKGQVLRTLALVAGVAFVGPNIYRILGFVDSADSEGFACEQPCWWHMRFSRFCGLCVGLLLLVALFGINFESSEFLYFQF